MKSFTDKEGRVWNISLTIGSALRVKNTLDGVDLLQPELGDPPLITRFGTDEMFLAEVICALLGDQFEKLNVSAEDMYLAMDGDTIQAAQKAFYDEMIAFFLSRGRPDRVKMLEKQRDLITLATAKISDKIEKLDLEKLTDKISDINIDDLTLGLTSGKSPESLA